MVALGAALGTSCRLIGFVPCTPAASYRFCCWPASPMPGGSLNSDGVIHQGKLRDVSVARPRSYLAQSLSHVSRRRERHSHAVDRMSGVRAVRLPYQTTAILSHIVNPRRHRPSILNPRSDFEPAPCSAPHPQYIPAQSEPCHLCYDYTHTRTLFLRQSQRTTSKRARPCRTLLHREALRLL